LPGKKEATQFLGSVKANLFEIWYVLTAYVKHDSWNEFGDGNKKDLVVKMH
jgi:hypothetical protein